MNQDPKQQRRASFREDPVKFFKEVGAKGGHARALRHPDKLREWASLGGRGYRHGHRITMSELAGGKQMSKSSYIPGGKTFQEITAKERQEILQEYRAGTDVKVIARRHKLRWSQHVSEVVKVMGGTLRYNSRKPQKQLERRRGQRRITDLSDAETMAIKRRYLNWQKTGNPADRPKVIVRDFGLRAACMHHKPNSREA